MIFKIMKPFHFYACIIFLFILFFMRNDANAQNYTVGVFVSDTICADIKLDTGTYNENYMSIKLDSTTMSSYVTGVDFYVEITEVHGFATVNMSDTLHVGDILAIPAASASVVLKIYLFGKNNFTKFNIIVVGTPVVAGEVYFCNINCAITLAVLFNSATVYAVNDETCTVQPNVSVDRNQKDPRPGELKLNQNYPNPFNPATTISYSLPENDYVEIKIYNIKGEMITTLLNQPQKAGNHQVIWNGCDESGNTVTNGVYYYQIKTDRFTMTKKMVLLR